MSSVNRQRGWNRGKSMVLIFLDSYTEQMISPAIAPSILLYACPLSMFEVKPKDSS
jgi:hypothetical protein